MQLNIFLPHSGLDIPSSQVQHSVCDKDRRGARNPSELPKMLDGPKVMPITIIVSVVAYTLLTHIIYTTRYVRFQNFPCLIMSVLYIMLP